MAAGDYDGLGFDALLPLIEIGRKFLRELTDAEPTPEPTPTRPSGIVIDEREIEVLRNCARTVWLYGENGRRLFNQLLAEIVFEETQP